MSENRRRLKLRELCNSIDYGLTARASTDPVGPRFLRITDIVGGHLDWSVVPYVDCTEADARKYSLHAGDIVVARTGATTGYSAYVSHPPEAVFASYLVRFAVSEEHDPRFVSYLLKGPQWWDYIQAVLGDKSAQPNASASTLADAWLDVPCLTEQRAIAEVLGALDDKIEANLRTRTTARLLAMTVYSQWCLKDSTRATVADLALSVARGIAPKYVDSGTGIGVQVLNQKCIRDGWVTTDLVRWMQPGPVKPERVARHGDVLVNSTGVGTLGRVGRWMGDAPIHVDGHVSVVRPDPSKYPPSILGYSLLAAQSQIEELAEGSTGQTELSRDRLGALMIELPRSDQIATLASLLDEVDNLAESLSRESRVLDEVRATLLPRLLSGELRVRNTEALMG